MKLELLLGISLLGNVALGIYALRSPSQPDAKEPSVAAASPSTNRSVKGQISNAKSSTQTNTVVRNFNWESVESADYREYIENLRSVGCPEETIRDIIIADVTKLYDQKKKAVRGESKKYEYWKSGFAFMGVGDSETMEQIEALDEERNQVLRSLGIEPDFRAMAAQMMNPMDTMFDFLPEEKKRQVLQVFSDLQKNMRKAMEGGNMDGEEMMKYQKESELAVKALLTPEEALAYDLRMGMTANTMRSQVAGWDPNETEFLKVHELRKTYDDQYSPMMMGNESDEQRKEREAASTALNEQIKKTLGEERYADYERAQDWSYQQIHQAARKSDLGTAEANQVWEMKQAAEKEVSRLHSMSDLSQEQKTAALTAIQQETERSLQSVLGEKGWESYNRRQNTWWLKNMVPEAPEGVEHEHVETEVVPAF